jgi:hypothetical protein
MEALKGQQGSLGQATKQSVAEAKRGNGRSNMYVYASELLCLIYFFEICPNEYYEWVCNREGRRDIRS